MNQQQAITYFQNCLKQFNELPSVEIPEAMREKTEQSVQAYKSAIHALSALEAATDKYIFYEKMLCAIAEGEANAVSCDNCAGVYLESWFDGQCPYCEVPHDRNCIIGGDLTGQNR
jgi:hypothetical protein